MYLSIQYTFASSSSPISAAGNIPLIQPCFAWWHEGQKYAFLDRQEVGLIGEPCQMGPRVGGGSPKCRFASCVPASGCFDLIGRWSSNFNEEATDCPPPSPPLSPPPPPLPPHIRCHGCLLCFGCRTASASPCNFGAAELVLLPRTMLQVAQGSWCGYRRGVN